MKGRGTGTRPPNRFESVHSEADWTQVEDDEDFLSSQQSVDTVYLPDDSQSIISENNSPDIPFRYSVNPYRGCSHGCSYCYARPTHEYLGMNAGIDFESKILVKERAPSLLREWLARSNYKPEVIVFSGVTDCYQPAERDYQLTRQCLEVALEARQPIGIITKNALLTRDIDLLGQMASMNLVSVSLSVTTRDQQLARKMEPRTSSPMARLRAIAELSNANIPVGVMTAPIIPGLNDVEIPAILQAASEAGATAAGYVMLRLPLNVEPVFIEWLERTLPDKADRVLNRLRETRDGQINVSRWGERMRGKGTIADQIGQTFKIFAAKFSINNPHRTLDTSRFKPPRTNAGQQFLF